MMTFIDLVIVSGSFALADAVYYVDGSKGQDSNVGTSQNAPWRSLSKINNTTFNPGDRILLKAGCSFNGQLKPTGSGAVGKPVIVDKYGSGANPIIKGEGKVENAIRLHNQQYWEIRNLTVTNTDGGGWNDNGRTIRRGIYVTATDAGDINHIYLQNLEIRDVRGMYRFKGNQTNGGIICQVTGEAEKTRFVDLRIEDCVFRTKSIDRYPVVVTSSWGKEHPGEIVYRNNRLDHAGRAHIVIPADQWPRKLVYYFDPEVRKTFPLDKTAAPVSPFTGRVGCEDIFSEMAARLKHSWSFFEATRHEEGRWLFTLLAGDKDYSLWATAGMALDYYGELRAMGFESPWNEKQIDEWIGEINRHINAKTGLLNVQNHIPVGDARVTGKFNPTKPGYISNKYHWSLCNRVFMAHRYTLPPGALHGADPLPTKEAARKKFHSQDWLNNPYGAGGGMGHYITSHRQVFRAAGKDKNDEIVEMLHKMYDALFVDGHWGAKGSPDGNMKVLVTYSILDWPIPNHKKLIDYTLSFATDKAGFAGRGCHSFNQMYSLIEARRQFPDGYRGDEIDRHTAKTFINFLNNWNENLNFYSDDWNGKHNNGVPLFMAHLILDLPIMRASSIYNWRETPVITRDKKGKIKRNKVIYHTKGFEFNG